MGGAIVSLVVAEAHDDRISLVADTKVTVSHDDDVTRHVFENAFPKLLLLRDDLCVGLAGNDPEGVAGDLVAARQETVESVVHLAESMPYASFVIASLTPEPRLIQVDRGSVEDRTVLGRAWAGDEAAYSIFQRRYSEWPPGMEVPFLLISSLQWLLSFGSAPSVGGYLTNVVSTPEGFRYLPQVTNVGPELLSSLAELVDGDLKLRLSAPPPVATRHSIRTCVRSGCLRRRERSRTCWVLRGLPSSSPTRNRTSPS